MKVCPVDCASLSRTVKGIHCITYCSKLTDNEVAKVIRADERCMSAKVVPDSPVQFQAEAKLKGILASRPDL